MIRNLLSKPHDDNHTVWFLRASRFYSIYSSMVYVYNASIFYVPHSSMQQACMLLQFSIRFDRMYNFVSSAKVDIREELCSSELLKIDLEGMSKV